MDDSIWNGGPPKWGAGTIWTRSCQRIEQEDPGYMLHPWRRARLTVIHSLKVPSM